jgi:antitoxin component of MazEF toxin-antitoxin module
MQITKENSKVQSWGNSTAIRLPKQIASLLSFDPNDPITFIVEMDSQGNKKLIVIKNESHTSIKNPFMNVEEGSLYHTMEDLYDGGEVE